MTYKNATQYITLEEAMRFHEETGVALVVNDGEHVTLVDDEN